MGYRSSFSIVKKDIIAKIQSALSEDEAVEILENSNTPEIEMGKYYESQEIIAGYPELKWLHTDDTESVIGDGEMLLRAIKHEKEAILGHLDKLINNYNEKDIKQYLSNKRMWIAPDYFINLDVNKTEVSGCWLREYEIFNLVTFYKSFNPDTDVVLYSAG